jgi:integrase
MRWLATKVDKAPKTYAEYKSVLRDDGPVMGFFANKRLGSIRREHIQTWSAQLRRAGTSGATVRKAYRVLAMVLAEAEISGAITRSPAFKIDLPPIAMGEQRFLSPTEVKGLAAAIERRFRALVLTAALTGLRWGELAGLRIDDIDFRVGAIVVRRTLSEVGKLYLKDTKSHRVRVVPLPQVLVRELGAHIDAGYSGADVYCVAQVDGEEKLISAKGFLFSSWDGGLLRHSNTYKKFFKPALTKAGLDPGLRFHDLRHSAASIAGSRRYGGQSAKVVQALLGHSSQQVTTDIYTHIFPEELEGFREKLDAIYSEILHERPHD